MKYQGFGTRAIRFLVYALLGGISVLFALPLIWMVLSAFKSNAEIFTDPFGLPSSIDLSQLARAWNTGNIGRYALNSIVVTTVSVLGILIAGLSAAFALSRFRFPLRSTFYMMFIVGLILPIQSYFIAQSTMFRSLDILDTYWALIIPYIGISLPLTIFLLKTFVDALPEEVFEAAKIDGAGHWRVFISLAVPLVKPGLATAAVFAALSTWNEFLLALLYIQDSSLRTIPTGLVAFASRYSTDYSLLFAGLTIVTVPMLVVYAVLNRQIAESLTAGSVK